MAMKAAVAETLVTELTGVTKQHESTWFDMPKEEKKPKQVPQMILDPNFKPFLAVNIQTGEITLDRRAEVYWTTKSLV